MRSVRDIFTIINQYIDENVAANLKNDWNAIEKLVTDKSEFKCVCGTYWINNEYISTTHGNCAMCDVNISPYPTNPKNWRNTLKYIDRNYWRFMFPIYDIFDNLENKDDVFQYINAKTTPKNVYILYKIFTNEGLTVKLAQQDGVICRNIFIEYGTSYNLESDILEDLEIFNFINSHDITFQLLKYW